MLRIILALFLLIPCALGLDQTKPPLANPSSVAPPLAQPAATADDWQTNAPAAAQAAASQAKLTAASAPAPSNWWESVLLWTGGAIGLLLTVGKRIPGLTGLLAEGGDLIWSALSPKSRRDADARQAVAADGLAQLVRIIQMLPNEGTIAELKSKIHARMPSEAKDVINALVVDLESRGVSSPMILTTIETPTKPPSA